MPHLSRQRPRLDAFHASLPFRGKQRVPQQPTKLEAHLRECQCVVSLIGASSGAGFTTETEAAPYAHLLPRTMARASYTQWEFLLARSLRLRPLAYRPHIPAAPGCNRAPTRWGRRSR